MKIFITGASGWIGSAVVPELMNAGHQVVGIARSDASAKKLEAAGVEVVLGSIDDLELLKKIAVETDGVIHLAFKHEEAFQNNDFAGAAKSDRDAVEAFGEALAGTDKPFTIASGVIGLTPGKLATEADGLESTDATKNPESGPAARLGTAHVVLGLADKGVRSSIVRLAPTVHGEGDNGFMSTLAGIAKQTGKAAYVADGSARWPAVNRADAAQLFRLAIEKAPAGSVLHAVAEEGVAMKDIATAIGDGLDVPTVSIPAEEAGAQFGFLAGFVGVDSPVSSDATQALVDWHPSHPGLIDDIKNGYYFEHL